MQAAALDFSKVDREGEPRDALKDDVKIIAQAMVKDAAWIITADTRSFYKFAQELRTAGTAKFRPMKQESGFDLAHFDPNGQRQLGFDTATDEPETEE